MCKLVTGRNEVVAKVMFLQASVILSTGGCLPQCMLGYHSHPPGSRHPHGSRHPPGSRHPLGADTPPGSRYPPGVDTPSRADTSLPREQTPQEAGSGIRSMSGRYASYWNTFLFIMKPVWSASGWLSSYWNAFLLRNTVSKKFEEKHSSLSAHAKLFPESSNRTLHGEFFN